MAKKGKLEIFTSKTDEHWVTCPSCRTETSHLVVVSIERLNRDDEGHFESKEELQIIQCRGCKEMSFRKNEQSEDNVEFNEENGSLTYVDYVELYPPRVEGRKGLDNQTMLPLGIRPLYRETFQALCNNQPVLASAGIRMLVEAVCRETNASGKDLEKKIDSLIGIGVLTADGAKILHSLRLFGNAVVHEIQAPDNFTLGLAFDAVEHLLNAVYILPAKAAHIDVVRRAKAKARPGT